MAGTTLPQRSLEEDSCRQCSLCFREHDLGEAKPQCFKPCVMMLDRTLMQTDCHEAGERL